MSISGPFDIVGARYIATVHLDIPALKPESATLKEISSISGAVTVFIETFSLYHNVTMVHVAVAGGTGHVGQAIVQGLADSQEHQVYVFTRKVSRGYSYNGPTR